MEASSNFVTYAPIIASLFALVVMSTQGIRLDKWKLKRSSKDDYWRAVETPIDFVVHEVDEYSCDVSDFKRGIGACDMDHLQSRGARVMRKVNLTINSVTRESLTDNAEWLAINTDAVELALEEFNVSPDGLHAKALQNALRHVQDKLTNRLRSEKSTNGC